MSPLRFATKIGYVSSDEVFFDYSGGNFGNRFIYR